MQITYEYSISVRKWSAKLLCDGSVIVSCSEASIVFKLYVKLQNVFVTNVLFCLKMLLHLQMARISVFGVHTYLQDEIFPTF